MRDGERDNTILVAINLDPHNEQAGWIDLDLKVLGIEHDQSFDVEDLLTGAQYTGTTAATTWRCDRM